MSTASGSTSVIQSLPFNPIDFAITATPSPAPPIPAQERRRKSVREEKEGGCKGGREVKGKREVEGSGGKWREVEGSGG
eukprot:1208140-Rhodomonas_salina.1